VILVTGATGTVGRALLSRLRAGPAPVRCLVRSAARVPAGVEVVLGDLADFQGFPSAVRGVEAVVHLAGPLRDQPGGTIEALTTDATVALAAAAERAGVRHFVFFSVLGATEASPARLLRAKAAAERALAASGLAVTVLAPAWIYDRDDPFMAVTRRLARLPVVPISGSGRARFEPIWAGDVAECVVGALAAATPGHFELAGPEVLSYEQITRVALGRPRRIVHLPLGLVRPGLRALGPLAPASWEEVSLLELELLSAGGTADAERLGVRPRRMAEVLTG
jgi:uncharacterized protein YbjT (DUF2867 family)